MGMQQTVTYPGGTVPSWPQVRDALQSVAFPVQMRMIDGELAFPDEEPAESWRELRLGTSAGMITVRRDPDHVTLVIWGNADVNLRHAWNAITWAFASQNGRVDTPGGPMSADVFRRTAELPEGF
jgi:hypothetical protein